VAYTINIGSVESFEKQLEEVQKLLEIDPHHFLPITYTTLPNWGCASPSLWAPLAVTAFLNAFFTSSPSCAGGC
jgi:hypothetical protein